MNLFSERCTNEELLARSRQCIDDSVAWLASFRSARPHHANGNAGSAILRRFTGPSSRVDRHHRALRGVTWCSFKTTRSGLSEVLYQLERWNLKVYGTGTFESASTVLLANEDVLAAELVFEQLGIAIERES